MHLLIWLAERIPIDEVDAIIWAEIPDQEVDPKLHALVIKHMLHGPCGQLNPGCGCMRDGRCRFKFPKDFVRETRNAEGFPEYRRRSPEDGGHTHVKLVRGEEFEFTNAWVAPYNPFLLRTFECHINVEYVASVKAIKYICSVSHSFLFISPFSLANWSSFSVHQQGIGRLRLLHRKPGPIRRDQDVPAGPVPLLWRGSMEDVQL